MACIQCMPSMHMITLWWVIWTWRSELCICVKQLIWWGVEFKWQKSSWITEVNFQSWYMPGLVNFCSKTSSPPEGTSILMLLFKKLGIVGPLCQFDDSSFKHKVSLFMLPCLRIWQLFWSTNIWLLKACKHQSCSN